MSKQAQAVDQAPVEDSGEYDAVRRADSALYIAKNGGCNRISVLLSRSSWKLIQAS